MDTPDRKGVVKGHRAVDLSSPEQRRTDISQNVFTTEMPRRTSDVPKAAPRMTHGKPLSCPVAVSVSGINSHEQSAENLDGKRPAISREVQSHSAKVEVPGPIGIQFRGHQIPGTDIVRREDDLKISDRNDSGRSAVTTVPEGLPPATYKHESASGNIRREISPSPRKNPPSPVKKPPNRDTAVEKAHMSITQDRRAPTADCIPDALEFELPKDVDASVYRHPDSREDPAKNPAENPSEKHGTDLVAAVPVAEVSRRSAEKVGSVPQKTKDKTSPPKHITISGTPTTQQVKGATVENDSKKSAEVHHITTREHDTPAAKAEVSKGNPVHGYLESDTDGTNKEANLQRRHPRADGAIFPEQQKTAICKMADDSEVPPRLRYKPEEASGRARREGSSSPKKAPLSSSKALPTKETAKEAPPSTTEERLPPVIELQAHSAKDLQTFIGTPMEKHSEFGADALSKDEGLRRWKDGVPGRTSSKPRETSPAALVRVPEVSLPTAAKQESAFPKARRRMSLSPEKGPSMPATSFPVEQTAEKQPLRNEEPLSHSTKRELLSYMDSLVQVDQESRGVGASKVGNPQSHESHKSSRVPLKRDTDPQTIGAIGRGSLQPADKLKSTPDKILPSTVKVSPTSAQASLATETNEGTPANDTRERLLETAGVHRSYPVKSATQQLVPEPRQRNSPADGISNEDDVQRLDNEVIGVSPTNQHGSDHPTIHRILNLAMGTPILPETSSPETRRKFASLTNKPPGSPSKGVPIKEAIGEKGNETKTPRQVIATDELSPHFFNAGVLGYELQRKNYGTPGQSPHPRPADVDLRIGTSHKHSGESRTEPEKNLHGVVDDNLLREPAAVRSLITQRSTEKDASRMPASVLHYSEAHRETSLPVPSGATASRAPELPSYTINVDQNTQSTSKTGFPMVPEAWREYIKHANRFGGEPAGEVPRLLFGSRKYIDDVNVPSADDVEEPAPTSTQKSVRIDSPSTSQDDRLMKTSEGRARRYAAVARLSKWSRIDTAFGEVASVGALALSVWILYHVFDNVLGTPTAAPLRAYSCTDMDCPFIARYLVDRSNRTINPCDDFYERVCYSWLHGDGKLGYLSSTAQTYFKQLEESLLKMDLPPKEASGRHVFVGLYFSCLHHFDDKTPFSQILNVVREELGDSVFLKPTSKWPDIFDTLITLALDYDIASLFRIAVLPGMGEGGHPYISLTTVGSLRRLLGVSQEIIDSSSFIDEIVQEFSDFVHMADPVGDVRDLDSNFSARDAAVDETSIHLKDLEKLFPSVSHTFWMNRINRRLQREVGDADGRTDPHHAVVDAHTTVLLAGHLQIWDLFEALFNLKNPNVARLYINVMTAANTLRFEFMKTRFEVSRSYVCLELIRKAVKLNWAELVVDVSNFGTQAVVLKSFFEDVRANLVSILVNKTWLGIETRLISATLVNKTLLKAFEGPPHFIPAGFEDAPTLSRGAPFVQNYLRALGFQAKAILRHPLPSLREAYLDTQLAHVPVFAAYFLQFSVPTYLTLRDVFFVNDDEYFHNFATLGVLIAHAFMEGVVHYYRPPWDALHPRSSCKLEQYRSVFTEHAKSNFDDSAVYALEVAVRAAFESLRRYSARKLAPSVLQVYWKPLSRIFFERYCLLTCENAIVRGYRRTRQHCVMPLQAMSGFASAYDCPVGSRMNPKIACDAI